MTYEQLMEKYEAALENPTPEIVRNLADDVADSYADMQADAEQAGQPEIAAKLGQVADGLRKLGRKALEG